jgi:hypothetical protein
MSEVGFFRVHDSAPDARDCALRSRISAWRGASADDEYFAVNTAEFSVIPGSPFAYWVSESIRDSFRRYPPLDGNAGIVQHGASTKNDFRFLRLWWEVAPHVLGFSLPNTYQDQGWVHFAKGGSYSPYYADLHLVIRWKDNAAEIAADVVQKYPYLKGDPEWVLHRSNRYFEPGITWPLRTNGLSFRIMPAGAVFGHKGPAAFASNARPDSTVALLAVLNSQVFLELVRAQLARTALAQSYEIGLVGATPLPATTANAPVQAVYCMHDLRREPAASDETSHVFSLVSLMKAGDCKLSLIEVAAARAAQEVERNRMLSETQQTIEEWVFDLYGFGEEERRRILYGPEDMALPAPIESDADTADAEALDEDDEETIVLEDLPTRVANLFMWCVGVALGRWDVRMARDPSLIPALQGPFERLPRIAPGGLIGPDGLPATLERIASEAWLRARPDVITLPEPGNWAGPDSIPAEEYPIEVAWDGILVDDEGHPRDIVARVRAVLALRVRQHRSAPRRSRQEALEILQGERGRTPRRPCGSGSVTQKASELEQDLSSTSTSSATARAGARRRSTGGWPATRPGGGRPRTAVWLYYHRLTQATPSGRSLSEYVGPKRHAGGAAARGAAHREGRRLRGQSAEKRRIEREIEEQGLAAGGAGPGWRGELRAVAERGYRPDLDDGVVINAGSAAPSWCAWKEPEKIWKELEKGEVRLGTSWRCSTGRSACGRSVATDRSLSHRARGGGAVPG